MLTRSPGLQPELSSHALAHALRDSDRDVEALAVFRDLVRRRPDDPNHLCCFGDLLNRRGRKAEATAVFDHAAAAVREQLRRRPTHFVTYNILGRALHGLKQYDEAIAAYRKAIQLKPDNERDIGNIAQILRDQGKLEEAVAQFRKALELNPGFVECHAELGGVFRLQGKLDLATAEFREAIRLAPDDPDLKSVRDPDALAKIPTAERAAWQALWSDVAARARFEACHWGTGVSKGGQAVLNSGPEDRVDRPSLPCP